MEDNPPNPLCQGGMGDVVFNVIIDVCIQVIGRMVVEGFRIGGGLPLHESVEM